MTFSLAGRCARTGAVGVVIASASMAVAARCVAARAGVGAVCSQSTTDPRLREALLSAMAEGAAAGDALAAVVGRAADVAYRQLVAVDELVDVEAWLALLGEVPTAAKLRDCLREGLRGAGSDRWWKKPSSGRGGHKKVKTRVLGNHTSTYRVLQQAREQGNGPPIAARRP